MSISKTALSNQLDTNIILSLFEKIYRNLIVLISKLSFMKKGFELSIGWAPHAATPRILVICNVQILGQNHSPQTFSYPMNLINDHQSTFWPTRHQPVVYVEKKHPKS